MSPGPSVSATVNRTVPSGAVLSLHPVKAVAVNAAMKIVEIARLNIGFTPV
jgi:hypothetical protein